MDTYITLSDLIQFSILIVEIIGIFVLIMQKKK